jgi:SAM-dependent methyltransferase
MTGAPFDPYTLDFYAREASAYAAHPSARASRHLPAFLARLAPGARILELGCGGGLDGAQMIAAGFDVDATDGSPDMAALAAQRLGRPVRTLRFEELDAVDAYDAVWANASLLHAPRAALPDIIGRIWRALRPGGWHFASYKCGEAEGRDSLGRYYNYPDPDALIATCRAAADWAEMLDERYPGGGYDGVPVPWIAVTLRKPGG